MMRHDFMDGYSHRNIAQLFLIAHGGYMIQWIKPYSTPGRQINVTADRCRWQMIPLEDWQLRNLHFHATAARDMFCGPGFVVVIF